MTSYRSQWGLKPAGAFELAYNTAPVSSPAFRVRQEQRYRTEQADRIARYRAGRVPVLGRGRMSGWDWIRFGRTIRPADPFGVRGVHRTVRVWAERGVQAQQLEIPASVSRTLADSAEHVSIVGPDMDTFPKGRPRTPVLTAAAGDTQRSQGAELLYIGAALVLAFLILKRGR